MAMTLSERIIKQTGKPVECDICHKLKVFGTNWFMSAKKELVCPSCQDKVGKSGGLLVSI